MAHRIGHGDGSTHLLQGESVGAIIGAAVALGVIHVLTGPDHIGALTALSSGMSWRAFFLGVKWGCGHSLGMILVAIFCVFVGHSIKMGSLRAVINYCTGIFMIVIGVWTYKNVKAKYQIQVSKQESNDTSYKLLDEEETCKQDAPIPLTYFDCFKKKSKDELQTSASICVGILHGIGGPGGVYGILPAVAMKHMKDSLIYITCFSLSTVLCMGLFAACYGEITNQFGTRSDLAAYRIGLISSSISIGVGAVWIILQSCGALDSLFD